MLEKDVSCENHYQSRVFHVDNIARGKLVVT
jgi:hypothetical protein